MHKLIELRKFMKGMYYQMLDFAESECSYNLNQENVNKIADTFKKRNESLAKEIDLHCQPGRTVFVIAGTSHILKSNSLFEFSEFSEGVDLLHNVLKNHKFVIYVKREDTENKGIAKANPQLKIYK